jgi:hypothetical protein
VKKTNNVQHYPQKDDIIIKKFLKTIESKQLTDEEIEYSMSDEFAYLDKED